jgi:hypothetical protein
MAKANEKASATPKATTPKRKARGRGLAEHAAAEVAAVPVEDLPEASLAVRAAHYVEGAADAVLRAWLGLERTTAEGATEEAQLRAAERMIELLEKAQARGFEASYPIGGAGWVKRAADGTETRGEARIGSTLSAFTDSGRIRLSVTVPMGTARGEGPETQRRYDVATQALSLVIRGVGVVAGDRVGESGAAKALFERIGGPQASDPTPGALFKALRAEGAAQRAVTVLHRAALAAFGSFAFPGASSGPERVRSDASRVVGVATLWTPEGTQVPFGERGSASVDIRLPGGITLPPTLGEDGEPRATDDGQVLRQVRFAVLTAAGEPRELRLTQVVRSYTTTYTPGSKRR